MKNYVIIFFSARREREREKEKERQMGAGSISIARIGMMNPPEQHITIIIRVIQLLSSREFSSSSTGMQPALTRSISHRIGILV